MRYRAKDDDAPQKKHNRTHLLTSHCLVSRTLEMSTGVAATVLVASASAVAKLFVVGGIGYVSAIRPKANPILPAFAMDAISRMNFNLVSPSRRITSSARPRRTRRLPRSRPWRTRCRGGRGCGRGRVHGARGHVQGRPRRTRSWPWSRPTAEEATVDKAMGKGASTADEAVAVAVAKGTLGSRALVRRVSLTLSNPTSHRNSSSCPWCTQPWPRP